MTDDLKPEPAISGATPDAANVWLIAWAIASVVFTMGGWIMGTPVAELGVDPVVAGAACAGISNGLLNIAFLQVMDP